VILTLDKLSAVPTARVARTLTPLTFSTCLQLVGGAAPKPPSLFEVYYHRLHSNLLTFCLNIYTYTLSLINIYSSSSINQNM